MQSNSPLDGYRSHVEKWLREGKSHAQVAHLVATTYGFTTSERSIRRAARRWGVEAQSATPRPERENFHLEGDEAQFTTEPRVDLDDIDGLIRERGLDPADWEVSSVTVNKWDSPTGDSLKQLKVHLKRKKLLHMVVPARVALGRVFTRPVLGDLAYPELVVFVSDQHAPYQDPELHKRFCAFLADQQPRRGVLVGDTLDLPTISRHAAEPEWAPTTQECIDAAGQLLLDLCEASPDTEWVKLPGNHDERLRRVIIDRLGEWYGLKPAQIEDFPDLPPIHDPVHLLRLDELGIEYIRPKGSYDHAQYMVSPLLAARHGWLARKGSGSSALATLDHLGHSAVVGHTHRQSIVHQTKHDIHGQAWTRAAMEIGCMCRIEHGLGYAPAPDWQQGFGTAAVFQDGGFKLDLATYVHQRLYWRSERY